MSLAYVERPSAGPPAGLLVLHHGRGADEHDLLPLADALDPKHRLQIVSLRAPLAPPGAGGYHWYLVPQVGHPDPVTFQAAFQALSEFHDELWERTGIGPERTVLAGFSMGAVMSYALGLSPRRSRPAGIMAFAGFIPTVAGWAPDLTGRSGLRVFMAHGAHDRVIDVAFARRAVAELRAGGLQVEYHESLASHHIDPRGIPVASAWLDSTLELPSGGA